jgi:hypothetical protein
VGTGLGQLGDVVADPFAQLAKLIGNLENLADKGADAVAEKLEPAINSVLQAEYEQGRGPNGETWAAKSDGSSSHLQDTGAMRAGTQAVRGVKGVSVKIPKPGGFHQGGTSKMVARKLVPDGEPLPGEWRKAAEDAARSTILDGLTK